MFIRLAKVLVGPKVALVAAVVVIDIVLSNHASRKTG
jgi:hypothetical protein